MGTGGNLPPQSPTIERLQHALLMCKADFNVWVDADQKFSCGLPSCPRLWLSQAQDDEQRARGGGHCGDWDAEEDHGL